MSTSKIIVDIHEELLRQVGEVEARKALKVTLSLMVHELINRDELDQYVIDAYLERELKILEEASRKQKEAI